MASALSNNIIDSYLALIKNLNPKAKLDLISKLTQSLQNDLKQNENLFESAFGAWEGDETADELIADIRDSRTFNRRVEEL